MKVQVVIIHQRVMVKKAKDQMLIREILGVINGNQKNHQQKARNRNQRKSRMIDVKEC